MAEGDIRQDGYNTPRAIEAMADWYDVIQVTGTDGVADLEATYPTLAVKGFGSADDAEHVVVCQTVNNTTAGNIEIRLPAGGFSGKLPKIKSIDATTTVVKLLLFVQKIKSA